MNRKIAQSYIDIGEEVLKEILEKIANDRELFVENMVILGLYSGILKKSKSLIILCENNSIYGTDSILRSVLESKVYLEFILQKYTKDRAKAYEYSLVIQNNKRKKWLNENVDKRLLMEAGFTDSMEGVSEDFEIIRAEYLNLTKRGSKNEKGDLSGTKWYKVGGEIDTFEGLCKHMGDKHLKDYHIVFKTFSLEVHGRDASRFWDSINNEEVLFALEQEIDGIYEWIGIFIEEAMSAVSRKYSIPMDKKRGKLSFLISAQTNSRNYIINNKG